MDYKKIFQVWKKGWSIFFLLFVLQISFVPIAIILRMLFDSATFYFEILFLSYIFIIGPVQLYFIFFNFFGKKFCESIVTNPEEKNKCSTCGEELKGKKDFCPSCGWTFNL